MSQVADTPPHEMRFDSVLLIAFGGPEELEDVRPFIANVLRGRAAPPERIEEVAHHYELIGGRSPLNEITRRQAAALAKRLEGEGLPLPVFVGMRNWHPYLRDTLASMASAGHRRTVGFILSAQQSEAGWERYVRDVAAAREALQGEAPEVDFVAEWHAEPLFIDAMVARVEETLAAVPAGRRDRALLVFTAHSIPTAMAEGSPYVAQLEEGARAIAKRLERSRHRVAYQSRSGNPRDPWLEPDIGKVVREEAAGGTADLVVVPLGFVCDHVEVLYDLDVEAQSIAREAGIGLWRAKTVNDHPEFIRMMAAAIRRHVLRHD